MDRRVVVTGVGVVSPIGIGEDEFWNNLINGVSGVRRITKFDVTDHECQIAAEVPKFDTTKYGIDRREAKRLDPFGLYSQVAVELVFKDSGLNVNGIEDRVGAIIATGVGGLGTIEEQCTRLLEKGPDKVSAFLVTKLMANAASGNASIKYNLQGPTLAVASACASGNHACVFGGQSIWMGDADAMIVGGSEAAIVPLGIAGFASMKALSLTHNNDPERASRPFDERRDGFVIGEGAGVVLLEELEHAKKRRAHIYAELIGYGSSSDAHHATEPSVEGQTRAMSLALKKAKLNFEGVDYINAHGTSTSIGDVNETRAIRNVFGVHADRLNISSTKSMTGHLLGAAGGLETVVCALAIDRGVIPPTINYEYPDDECNLNYVPNKSRELEVMVAMNNSFGFGGHNSVLVLKKYNG